MGMAKVLKRMVARDGVEPPTPAFSGLWSPAAIGLNRKAYAGDLWHFRLEVLLS